MIRIYRRPVDDSDLKEMKEGRGSFVRNIVTVTSPIAVGLFAAVYLASRPLLVAALISGLFFVGSVISNVRFFRNVRERDASKADEAAVEVMDVEAGRVLDIEHCGSHGPAYCFFTGDGKAVLLVGQGLLNYPEFPSLSFRLARWSEGGKLIRIEALGKR